MKKKIVHQAVKSDSGKLRYDLLPPRALEELVRVYNYGAVKYPSDRNWEKGLLWSRLFGAIQRHSWAFWSGNTFDKESKLHHLAHCAWSCLALIEYYKTHPEMDDRPAIQHKKRKSNGK